MAVKLNSRDLDRKITILQKVPGSGFMSAGKETWQPLATVWAQVQDVLPSRRDRFALEGLSINLRSSRIRIRFRNDVTSDMRIQFGARLMEIAGQPAELGFREGLEILAHDFSTQGTPA